MPMSRRPNGMRGGQSCSDRIAITAINGYMNGMASITIRNLDDGTKRKLRRRASRYGRSMEEEARIILRKALEPQKSQRGLGTAIHELFKSIGGSELEPMPREPLRDPPDFSSW